MANATSAAPTLGGRSAVVAFQARQAVVEAETCDALPADRRLGGAEGDARAADGKPLREEAEAGADAAAEIDDVRGRLTATTGRG